MAINKGNLEFSTNENAKLEKIVVDNGRALKIPSDKLFMHPGEKFEHLYFVKDGRTRHYMVDINGGEKILYVLSNGWFFGESCLILNYGESSLYSKTETDTTLYLIEKERAQDLIDNNKTFREGVMKSFAFKTMTLRYEIENILFNPSIERIKTFLCLNINSDNINNSAWLDIDSDYTHYEIGTLVGCTRVTVTKMLNRLLKEGFIRLVNNKIQINKEKYDDYLLKK